jgi:capsular polysaccharide biosynthesis protein
MVPEHVPCEGPSLPLLHILRGFVWRILGSDASLAPREALSSVGPTAAASATSSKQRQARGRQASNVQQADGGESASRITGGSAADLLVQGERVPGHKAWNALVQTRDAGKEHANAAKRRETIVLIRRDVSRRGVTNFDELLTAVKAAFPAHDVLVHTGKETLSEQWNMFKLAQAVAGPHGAAWSNVVAMRPRSVVLEFLVRGKDVNLCFLSAALKLGLIYRALSPEGSTHGGTMRVDTAEAVSVLSSGLRESN